jgi:phage tail tape-measure protein
LARSYRPEDFEVSDEEREASEALAEAEGYGSQGQAIGSLAGGALGALGFIGGPALGAATTGLGASLGGAAGGLIGGKLGSDKADKATDALLKAEEERQRKLQDHQNRQQALAALMGTR